MKQVSRVETAYVEIKQEEERLVKLFSPAILESRHFLKEKLMQYQELGSKFRGLNRQERLFINLIKDERNAIEKRLYPNRSVRIIMRIARKISGLQVFAGKPGLPAKERKIPAPVSKTIFTHFDRELSERLNRDQRKSNMQSPVGFKQSDNITETDINVKLEHLKVSNASLRDDLANLMKSGEKLGTDSTKTAEQAIKKRNGLKVHRS